MLSSLLALLFAVVMAPSAWADTSTSHETKNSKTYGNCQVATTVDMFTDAEQHILYCAEATLTDQTILALRHGAGKITIMLSKGRQFHRDPRIPVAIRIDKGQLIQRNAHWSRDSAKVAYIVDEQLARALLHDLAHGQRVAVQVGKERGHVLLDGSRKAVADFRQRVGLHAQQTLTIEQRHNLPASTR